MPSHGNITTVSILEPVLVGIISFISNLINNLLIPIIIISTILNIVSNISSEVNLSGLGTFIKKTALSTLEVMLIIFVGVLSLEGSLGANVDGILAKTVKSVTSTAIPVVGKLIGDAADSVLGATAITKNALGFVGILVIISICAIPLIKSIIILITLNVGKSFIESFADKRVSKCMENICDSTKIVVGILAINAVFMIISVTLLLKLSNFSLSIR